MLIIMRLGLELKRKIKQIDKLNKGLLIFDQTTKVEKSSNNLI